MAVSRLTRFRTRRQMEEDAKEERLYFSIQNGDANRLDQLLENGCNPDHKFEGANQLNKRLLHLSCEKGQEECAKVLLRHGANPEPQDAWFQTPLMYSVVTERDNMVKLMLQQDIDLDMTDKFGRSALHIAVNNVERDCMSMLIRGGADINISDEQGKNPLYHAITKDGRADVIKILLENNCDVNNRDMREKRMPLAAAIMNAKEDIVVYARMLLEAGAHPNASDHFGYTPMTSLIKRGFRDGAVVQDKHMEVAKLLVCHGHDVNMTLESKYWFQYSGSALKMATERNCPKFVLFLLQNHANPDINDDKGVTPLHVAAAHNYTDIAKLLIGANANLNSLASIKVEQAVDEIVEVTPVKYAFLNNSVETAQILLAAGCHVTHDDYLWCEVHAPNLLHTRPVLMDTSQNATPNQDSSTLAQVISTPNLRPSIRLNQVQRSNTAFESSMDFQPIRNHDVNQLVRSYTAPSSNSVTQNTFENDDVTTCTELQVMLSHAACQPKTLFHQTVSYMRRLLGQPFYYKVSCLVKHKALDEIVPIHRLHAWLHMTHLIGHASVE